MEPAQLPVRATHLQSCKDPSAGARTISQRRNPQPAIAVCSAQDTHTRIVAMTLQDCLDTSLWDLRRPAPKDLRQPALRLKSRHLLTPLQLKPTNRLVLQSSNIVK